MAKSDTTDILLGVFGVLGSVALIGGAAYAGVCARDSLREEHEFLRGQLHRLENRRLSSLTLRDMRRLQVIQGRISEIEEALGL